MPGTYDFFGKDVTEAIENACQELEVAHERLDIEIMKTGSAGIFGFAKKDAHIRVSVKEDEAANPDDPFGVSDLFAKSLDAGKEREEKDKALSVEEVPGATQPVKKKEVKASEKAVSTAAENIELSLETLSILQDELLHLIKLMGFTPSLEVTVRGRSVDLVLHGEHETELIGEDGKVLDSLQYIFRKIIDRKVAERLRLNLDVGDYRARRLREMKEKARELAQLVKKDGKTQAIPALSPAERREIHLLLRGDTEIHSRSVGDGMFKKILIYKPGSGGKGKKKYSRNRRGKARSFKKTDSNSGK